MPESLKPSEMRKSALAIVPNHAAAWKAAMQYAGVTQRQLQNCSARLLTCYRTGQPKQDRHNYHHDNREFECEERGGPAWPVKRCTISHCKVAIRWYMKQDGPDLLGPPDLHCAIDLALDHHCDRVKFSINNIILGTILKELSNAIERYQS